MTEMDDALQAAYLERDRLRDDLSQAMADLMVAREAVKALQRELLDIRRRRER